MKELDDSTLVQRLVEHDDAAFEELYLRYWKYVYAIALRKTGDKDHAFDLCQSVFMELFEKRKRLTDNMPIKAYLRKAIIYKLLNFFRSNGFRERHYQHFHHYLTQQELVVEGDPIARKEADLAFEDLVDMVFQVVEDMPERMKAIFKLSKQDNQSIAQIATSLELSQQTVKNQLSRAYQRIREAAYQQGVSPTELMVVFLLMNC